MTGSDRLRSDAEVIEASLAQPDAFAVIFHRHYQAIHRYLVRRVGPEDGPELASETFIRAFDQRDRFDRKYDSARPWLFGIAGNLVRMESRRRYREAKAVNALSGELATISFEVDVAFRTDAAREAEIFGIQGLLAEMGDVDRQVLLLHALGDLSNDEIAQALDLPIGTVKSKLSQTRQRLRELFSTLRQTDDIGGYNGE